MLLIETKCGISVEKICKKPLWAGIHGPKPVGCRAVRSWSGPRTNLGNQGPTRTGTEYFCVTAYLKCIRSKADSYIAVRGSLIIGIAYPMKKKDEKNDEVGDKDDLVDSLRKLIMGKFEDKDFEFFQWSRTMHDEVVLVIDKLFHNCCY